MDLNTLTAVFEVISGALSLNLEIPDGETTSCMFANFMDLFLFLAPADWLLWARIGTRLLWIEQAPWVCA